MNIVAATNQQNWDAFLAAQTYSPFLQSWTMGEVYRGIGQEPIRLEAHKDGKLVGICQAIEVDARRGKHLIALYGPVVAAGEDWNSVCESFLGELHSIAQKRLCAFLRISPFVPVLHKKIHGSLPSPLHTLGEHVWHIPLKTDRTWGSSAESRTEEDIQKDMRKNTRNLIRRAEREGVTVRASDKPMEEIDHFLKLHNETRKRHQFTPYPDSFFCAQLEEFSKRGECTLYLAEYDGKVIASSMHMHMGGETSYHHGASTAEYNKIPASYLLQWTAIRDALTRGDHTYSFWGIAPMEESNGKLQIAKRHPFAGVTLFKKGFGGQLLELEHCFDIPITKKYYLTRGFEFIRKWRRGF